MFQTLNGKVVTGVCILFTTYSTVYLRSVRLSALYFNEVISIEKIGKNEFRQFNKLLSLETEKRNRAQIKKNLKLKSLPIYFYFAFSLHAALEHVTIPYELFEHGKEKRKKKERKRLELEKRPEQIPGERGEQDLNRGTPHSWDQKQMTSECGEVAS